MYYRSSAPGSPICYAESKDGATWTKPILNLIDIDGSSANNAILPGSPGHTFCPFIDTNKHSAASTVELPISFRLNTQGYGQIFNNFPHRQVFSNKEDLNLTGSSGLLISGSSDNIQVMNYCSITSKKIK